MQELISDNFNQIDKWYRELDAGEVDTLHLNKKRQYLLKNMPLFSSKLLSDSSIAFRVQPRLEVDEGSGVVYFGKELDDSGKAVFSEELGELIPWRKGPYNLAGVSINAEWDSSVKWDRLFAKDHSFIGQNVCDIGCNSGYFLWRALSRGAQFVLGVEPVLKNFSAYLLLKQLAGKTGHGFELAGVEDMNAFSKVFDTVLCLGILYHHTDPMGLLKKIKNAMKPGGEIIIDCQGIDDPRPMALIPGGKYCGAKGIWQLPSASAIENWLKRANYRDIEVMYSGYLNSCEQRKTEWAPFETLGDFLDPKDSTKTIEGYPAPYRIYVRAKK